MRVEDAKEVEIGRTYELPHVVWCHSAAITYGRPAWVPRSLFIPILGGLHEDREIIGFPDDHWHIDWRFVPETSWRAIGKLYSRERDHNTTAAYRVISEKNTTGIIFRKKRKCLRSHITFPSIGQWHEKLEETYASARMKCMTCPHRGISLIGSPAVNGALICPGHGLAWSAKTGAMITRKSLK